MAVPPEVVGLVIVEPGPPLGGQPCPGLCLFGARPLVAWTVEALRGACDRVVVLAPAGLERPVRVAVGPEYEVRAVPAGDRAAAVRAGLAAAGGARYVLVQDAARPLAPGELGHRVLAALRSGAGAVLPVLPLADTVKVVDRAGRVLCTPDRAGLRVAQGPRGFAADVLRAAQDRAGPDPGDELAAVRAAGSAVRTVAGDPAAVQVTTATELAGLGAAP